MSTVSTIACKSRLVCHNGPTLLAPLDPNIVKVLDLSPGMRITYNVQQDHVKLLIWKRCAIKSIKTRVRKYWSTLAVPIPKFVASKLGLKRGDIVEIRVVDPPPHLDGDVCVLEVRRV